MDPSTIITLYGLPAIKVAEAANRLPRISRDEPGRGYITRLATSIADARKHLHDSMVWLRAPIGPLLDDINPNRPEDIEDAIRALPDSVREYVEYFASDGEHE